MIIAKKIHANIKKIAELCNYSAKIRTFAPDFRNETQKTAFQQLLLIWQK